MADIPFYPFFIPSNHQDRCLLQPLAREVEEEWHETSSVTQPFPLPGNDTINCPARRSLQPSCVGPLVSITCWSAVTFNVVAAGFVPVAVGSGAGYCGVDDVLQLQISSPSKTRCTCPPDQIAASINRDPWVLLVLDPPKKGSVVAPPAATSRKWTR